MNNTTKINAIFAKKSAKKNCANFCTFAVMNQSGFHFFKFVFILLVFALLCVDTQGQTNPEMEFDDGTPQAMTEEGGKNYAPAYYYYTQSLFPITIKHTLIDTSVYNPYNEDVSLFSRNLYANLGIFGQANYSMNFSFYRKHGFSYKTLPYNTYLRTIENWKLFLPEGVYTNLQYNFSNVKENRFSVTHAQKIADNLHLDLGLETIIAEGRYLNQKIRNVNFGTSLRYNLPSNRYGFAAYYYLNLIKNQENGGITTDSLFYIDDSGNARKKSPTSINVRFLNADNHLFQNTFFFRQYVSLSGWEKPKQSKKEQKIKRKNESESENLDENEGENSDETEAESENLNENETESESLSEDFSENETENEENESESEEESEEENVSTKTRKSKIGYLVHDFEFSSSKNLFSASGLDTTYFSMFNFSRTATNDSVKYYQIRNSILWSNFMPEDTMPNKKHFIRFAAGIMHMFINVSFTPYLFANLDDTIFNLTDSPIAKFTDNQLTPLGVLHLKLFKRLELQANAMITLNGYNAGDVTIDGKATLNVSQRRNAKHEIVLKMALYNHSPDYFFTHFMANNYRWMHNLDKQQTVVAGVAWEHKNYSIGLNYYTLNNYTLLNEHCQPEQIDNLANVYQLAAYIPFHFKGFGFNSNIYAQYTDNKKINIPIFATRQTVYYGFSLFKKAMYLQLGVDFLYNTAYYANEYNPVLQQFYLQNEKQIGNYPYLDAFLRAKLGRFQLQVKGTHLLEGLLGYNYYLIPHYPAKGRGFAVGILWNFYD